MTLIYHGIQSVILHPVNSRSLKLFVHKTKNLVCYVLKTLLFLELITLLGEAVTNTVFKKKKRKAMDRNWSNQKANPALKTKAGNK